MGWKERRGGEGGGWGGSCRSGVDAEAVVAVVGYVVMENWISKAGDGNKEAAGLGGC